VSHAPSASADPARPAPAATQAPPATDTAQSAPQAASPRAQETLAIGAPKSIEHVECGIVKPDYPAISRRRGETGTASVRFVIGVTGAIESAELAKSSGYERLDHAALAAMRASSCRPYVENGAPLRVTSTQPFVFALDD
jgi:protein TonB